MRKLSVDLDDRSYPIYIGSKLLARKELFIPYIGTGKVMVVSNTTIMPLYRAKLESALAGLLCEFLELPDGEQHKTLDSLNLIYTALLKGHFDRKCTLLALGGGVVGDITGFAAASYQRGVRFVQVPTTLLAQVDSSVGAKRRSIMRLEKI